MNAGGAFATIAGIETQGIIDNAVREVYKLSEQQCLDCAYETKGCTLDYTA